MTNNIKKCKYFDLNLNHLKVDKNHSLILLHVNIRSLHKNFELFHEFLVTLNFNPDIICLTETRLKNEPLINIELPHHKFVHVDTTTAAGGVAIYISDKLQYEPSPIQYKLSSSECLWLEVSEISQKSKFIVGVVYRHPVQTHLNEFLESFSHCLFNLSNSKKVYYILGDFNINLMQENRSSFANEYINLIVSNGAVPVITIPTRVTATSATLLDHIITNNMDQVINPAVIEADITDHYPILCTVHKPKYSTTKNSKMFYRDKSSFCADSFRNDLQADLCNVFEHQPELTNENFNEMFNLFSHTVLSTINIHAPLKPLSRKQKKLSQKPWITKGILTSIKKKRAMFKSHFLSDNLEKKLYFKKYMNKLTKIKALSKKSYFTTELKINQKDPRKIWDILRSALPASSKRAPVTSLKINGRIVSNQQVITEQFNEFFCSIGAHLASKFDNSAHSSYYKYLKRRVSPSIYLDVPELSEIINAINDLNINKAIGYDHISPYFLRIGSTILAPYIQVFIDYCFTNGIFPENGTTAKVVPIFKKGKRDNPTNYRPISILTCFAKILERIIYKRLFTFLKKHNVILDSQYGFQSNRSTNHALIDVITNSFDNINDKLYTGLIFLDLTKAFDTVNHEILLLKLDHYGIRGQANDLLRAFLKRKQFVSLNSHESSLLCNDFGVAQGSTLGPLLFLLYINDLPSSVNCIPRLFADDTCLLFSASNPSKLRSHMQKDLDNITEWFKANKLTVNPSKSNVLIIAPKLNKPHPHMDLSINNSPLPICQSAKYLGVIIDKLLNFDNHISTVEHKISRAVGIISKLRHYLPTSAILQIYYSLIHTHLLYGLIAWGSTYKSKLKKLLSLQNKAVKLIGGGLSRDSVTPLYYQLGILKLPDLFKFEIGKFVHAHFKNNLPPAISNFFLLTSVMSQKNTRSTQPQRNCLYIPRYTTNRLQKCIRYQGVNIWNDIPTNIQNSSFNLFKIRFKKHLLQTYNN